MLRYFPLNKDVPYEQRYSYFVFQVHLIYVDDLMLNPVEQRTPESTLYIKTSNDRLNA